MATEDHQKLLRALLQGEELTPDDERAIIQSFASTNPKSLPNLCQVLSNRHRQVRADLRAAREAHEKAQALLARALEPPWFPADVLAVRADGRLEVVLGGRRQVVAVMSGLDLAGLRPGDEVLLGQEQNAVIARGEGGARAGAVGVVAEVAPDRVVLAGVAGDEIVATCAPELALTLRPGDRVLHSRENRVVFGRLGTRIDSPYLLERTPTTTFADIGGLDDLIAEITRDLDLHLRHPERVRAYQLRLVRGITLHGPPGNGKTLLVRAIANYLAAVRGETRFLSVGPGALRGMFYGETEKSIRELFAFARSVPALVVIFFDEMDAFGVRGTGIGQDIDGRVLGALLAEIDGLEAAGNVLCIGATNRLDLCDAALIRPERLGGLRYHVPRPVREAARQIFSRHLTADLPYWPAGDGAERAAAYLEAAIAQLYAPGSGTGVLVTVTLANGERREVRAPDLVSGALLASAVQRAKHAAAWRHTDEAGGLTLEDVLDALDETLASEVEKLRAPHAARRLLDFAGAEEIVRVEVPARRRPRRHRYVRAA